MEKYYTPSLEEFHVGFEYEAFHNNDWYFSEGSARWIESSVPSWISFTTLSSVLEKGFIRVKYLDSEDIKSFGFVYDSSTLGGYDFFKNSQKHSILYNVHSNRCVITQYDNNRAEDYTTFVGVIKNKSELKKLLNQLGI